MVSDATAGTRHGEENERERSDTVSAGVDLSALTTESRHPGAGDLDLRTTAELVALMNAEDATVPAAVARAAPAITRLVDEVVARMRAGGRLIYVGAGSAGRIGQMDAAEVAPTFGVAPGRVIGLLAGGENATTVALEDVEDDGDGARGDLAAIGLTGTDAVVAVAASGRTPYTRSAAGYARELGAFTGAVVCNPGSPLAADVDVAIEVVVGPELISGSTRLKAGTAQKLVLNTISTAAMVGLGKTYGDLMVDLRPTNEKLRQRARLIVVRATGADLDTAAAALDAAGGQVRAAIVHIVTGRPIAEARRLADEHESLRRALEAAARP